MRIAIEAQRIFRHNKHGMDFVILEVLRELQKRNHDNEYYIFTAPGKDRCLTSSKGFTVIELKSWGGYPAWEQVALPRAVKQIKANLLHCTSNTAPLRCPVPLVLTLHDIIFLEPRLQRSASFYQEMGRYYRRLIVPRILNKCRRIITVSHFEREHIRQALNIPSERITAVYNGYNSYFSPQKPTPEELQRCIGETNDGYLFFLGNTDPKKNTVGMLKAYSIYVEQSAVKRPLLIADLKESDIDAILKQNNIEQIKPHLRCLGYIANCDLPTVYSGAFAFLYPSFRESFGIPILEAMACATPVITSNTSAMPEIADDAAFLISPQNPKEIAYALLRLESDNLFLNDLILRGIERAKKFTWKNTAKAYVAIYNEIIQSNH